MARNRLAIIAAAACALAGCTAATQPLAVALAGAGTSTAVGHSLNGTVYRTFTHTVQEVRAATIETLWLMGIRVQSSEPVEEGERIVASAIARSVEVQLEPISDRATRMRVVTRNGGIFYDAATSSEIVLQTEKALGVYEVTNPSAGPSRARPR